MNIRGYGKKALSLAVAVAMAASLCMPVWAEDELSLQAQTPETASTAETAQSEETTDETDSALVMSPSDERANSTTVEVSSDEEWQAAIANAAPEVETTVVLTQDLVVSKSVTVNADQILVVDFQGHSITVTPDFTTRIFTNNGKLTLKGNGTVDVAAADSTGYGTVNNFGTLTVVDGTYSNLNENANASNFYNRSGATATFENPTILSACGSVATAVNTTTTINGGTYTSKTYPTIENRGNMLITAGNFINTSCSACNGPNKWGYTVRSGESAEDAYLKIEGAAADSVQVAGVQGGLAVIGGTADIYNGVYKTEPCAIHGGNSAFYAGYFTGESYKTATNIYGGTFQSCSKTGILVGNGNPAPDSGEGKESTVMIFGGNFAGGDAAKTAITVNQTQYAVGAAKIYGGYFTSKPSEEFLGENLTYVGSDQAGYLYMVSEAGKNPAAVVEPADSKTENLVPETAPEEDKELAAAVAKKLDQLTVEQKVLEAEAETVANKNEVTTTDGTKELAEAGVDVENKTVTIVVQPYLDIQVLNATATATETTKKNFVLDVTPMYRTLATTADKNDLDSMVVKGEEDGKEPNTVVMGFAKKLEITQPVEMEIQLPDGFTTEQTLFVFHQKDDDRSYCYEGTVSGNVVTFTNPNGFSKFTFTTDTRKAVLDVDGTQITLTANMIGQTIPVPGKDGYTFQGVTVEGVTGYTDTYLKLTDELLTALSNAYTAGNNAPIKAHATFTKNSSGGSSGSSSSSSTTTNNNTPANTQSGPEIEYYTCPACGYHNWTATATGYKCDHCGYVESTKQLSSYGNVKGSYDPQSAVTQASATVAQGAIPQTSDDMPLVGLAVVAIVALLGLGVTVVLKKHHKQ